MKNSKNQKSDQNSNWIKNIALTLVLALNFFAVTAQNNFHSNSVSGIVFDQQHEPVLYGDIMLKNTSDQTIYATQLSDIHGFFKFSDIPPGMYQIEVSYMGVSLYKSDEFEHTEETVNLPLLTVDNFTHDMIVTVTADRNPIDEEVYLTTSNFKE